jgi:hypothetical protein
VSKIVREKQTRKAYWKLREDKAAEFNALAFHFISSVGVQTPGLNVTNQGFGLQNGLDSKAGEGSGSNL